MVATHTPSARDTDALDDADLRDEVPRVEAVAVAAPPLDAPVAAGAEERRQLLLQGPLHEVLEHRLQARLRVLPEVLVMRDHLPEVR